MRKAIGGNTFEADRLAADPRAPSSGGRKLLVAAAVGGGDPRAPWLFPAAAAVLSLRGRANARAIAPRVQLIARLSAQTAATNRLLDANRENRNHGRNCDLRLAMSGHENFKPSSRARIVGAFACFACSCKAARICCIAAQARVARRTRRLEPRHSDHTTCARSARRDYSEPSANDS
jgi:hypothetical protein